MAGNLVISGFAFSRCDQRRIECHVLTSNDIVLSNDAPKFAADEGRLSQITASGLRFQAFMISSNLTIQDSTTRNCSNWFGAETVVIERVHIDEQYGHIWKGNTARFYNSTFRNCRSNQAAEENGRLFTGMLVFEGCIFENNIDMLMQTSSPSTLTRCVLRNNTLVTLNQYAGLFYIQQGSFLLEESIFEGNTVPDESQGMFDIIDEAVFHRSTFLNNQGPIFMPYRTSQMNLTLDSCAFINNTADQRWGSVVGSPMPITILNSTFVGNSNTHDTGPLIAGLPLEVRDCMFRANPLSTGGALVPYPDSTQSPVMFIANTSFEANTGPNGAISLSGEMNAHLVNCTFTENLPSGAIRAGDDSTLLLESSTFISNLATTLAGAIQATRSAVVALNQCVFLGNQSPSGRGGALVVQETALISASGCHFEGNSAEQGGVAYVISQGGVELTNCTFTSNYAAMGGSLWMGSESVSIITGCVFTNNSAGALTGGAVVTATSSRATFEGCSFVGNSATNGGAIEIDDSSFVRMYSCHLNDNRASNLGGAVRMSPTSYFGMWDSLFTANTAGAGGGALRITSNNFVLFNSSFSLNRAFFGGAVSLDYVGLTTFEISGCSFMNNTADTDGGALHIQQLIRGKALRSEAGAEAIGNSSFVGNTAEQGGAVYLEEMSSKAPSFAGVLFRQNRATSMGGAVGIGHLAQDEIIFRNVSFQDNFAGYGGPVVGVLLVDHMDLPQNFSQRASRNCSYTGNLTPGWQDARGWAAAPVTLAGGISGKGGSVCKNTTLDGDWLAVGIQVTLMDGLGHPVSGPFVENFPMVAEMTMIGAESQPNVLADDRPISVADGTAMFDPLASYLQGARNQATVQFWFRCSNCSHSSLVPNGIHATTGCVFVAGCAPNKEPLPDPKDPAVDSCAQLASDDGANIVFILVVTCLCLLFCLVLIAVVFISWNTYRKMKRRIYEDMEIPDFANSSALSIEAILADSTIKQLPWEEICPGDVLGQGASGVVRQGTWGGQDIAIKELLLGTGIVEDLADFLKEIVILNALKDDHIVKIFGVSVPPDNSRLFLVTELMERGSVHDLLKTKSKNLPWAMRMKFALDAASGVKHLHKKKLIHRDLKTANLLVNKAWDCKIADFGISTIAPSEQRKMTCIGTPTHMAPEVLQREPYTEKADVYSFAIVMYELFSGQRAYSEGPCASMNIAVLNDSIVEGARPALDQHGLPKEMKELIADCWAQSSLRPSFKEIIIRLKQCADNE